MSEKKKIIGKKKVNKYSKSECEKELARLNEIKADGSVYADHIRRRLHELTHVVGTII